MIAHGLCLNLHVCGKYWLNYGASRVEHAMMDPRDLTVKKLQREVEVLKKVQASIQEKAAKKVNSLQIQVKQLTNQLFCKKVEESDSESAKSRHEKLEGSDSDEGSKKNEMKSKETETKKYSPDAGPSKNEKKGKDRMMKQQQVSEAEAERNSKSEAEFEKAGVKSEARAKVKKKEMERKKDTAADATWKATKTKAKEKMTEMETKKDSAADDATLKAAKAREKRKMETKKTMQLMMQR